MIARIVVGLFVLLAAALQVRADVAEKLIVTTLDWPPYTSPELPQLGATSTVVRRAFEQAGLEIEVKFLPWKRAISMAKNDPEVGAYFPGYHCRHTNGFVASKPIGYGPLGLVENVEAPITWKNINDLGEQKLKIGTVLGYANTDEFDEKADTGWVRAIPAKDDLTNMKKLLRKRIDAAVIDRLVLSYLLATEPAVKPRADDLRFDERPLEIKTLVICFPDNEEGHALRDRFNSGLKKLNVNEIVESYFSEQF